MLIFSSGPNTELPIQSYNTETQTELQYRDTDRATIQRHRQSYNTETQTELHMYNTETQTELQYRETDRATIHRHRQSFNTELQYRESDSPSTELTPSETPRQLSHREVRLHVN